jgi:hypothetical protein
MGNRALRSAAYLRFRTCGPAPMVKTMKTERVAFDTQLIVKAPRLFTDALDRAASMHFESKSAYVRAAIVARMKDDGIELTAGAA